MRLRSLVAAALALSASLFAQADTLQYTFSGPNVDAFSFTISSMPTVSQTDDSSYFEVSNIGITQNGVTTQELLAFQNGTAISFTPTNDFSGSDYYQGTSILYNGPYSQPTLLTGSFTLNDETDDTNILLGTGTLVVTDLSAVP